MSAGGHVKDSGRDVEGRSQGNRGLGAYRDTHGAEPHKSQDLKGGGKKEEKDERRTKVPGTPAEGTIRVAGGIKGCLGLYGSREPKVPGGTITQLLTTLPFPWKVSVTAQSSTLWVK